MRHSLLTALGFSLLCAAPFHAALAQNAAERADVDVDLSAEMEADAPIASGETLEDFFGAAMNYSPSLQIAEESWNIGKARRRAANGQLLPQINANGSISENRRDAMNDLTGMNELTTYRGERYSVQLSQVLFNWQAFSQRSQAYLVENQAEAEYYLAVATVLADVAEKYFNVLQAQDALASSDSELDALRNQANQVQRMHDLGMVQITDLYDVQARLAAVEAERQDLDSQLALTREALRAASGLAVGNLYLLSEDAQIPPLDRTVGEWVELAQQRSYEIQARELATEIADERISERRGAYMPRVNLIVQQQRANIGFDNAPTNRTDTGYVGLDVSIPLFAGGRNRAGVSEAISMRSIADNELRQVQLDVSERTRTAYLQARSGEIRTESARRLAEATELSSTARQRGFELGTVTSVDVLNALRDQFQAERELQRVRYEHIKANLILRREAGTLTAEDLLEVGSWLEAPPPVSAQQQ